MTKLLLAGDWHANRGWALACLRRAHAEGYTTIHHLGDFGVWPHTPSGFKYMKDVNRLAHELGITIMVTLGNHENYAWLSMNCVPHPTVEGFTYVPQFSNVLYAKRGARWTVDGVSFLSVGGANSIDREHRDLVTEWWDGERITLGDVYTAVAGGHADVMFTHERPTGADPAGWESFGWSAAAVAYAQQSSDMMRQIVDLVQPHSLFHGHYHFWADELRDFTVGDDSYQTRIVGLDKDGSLDRNLVEYEVGSGELSFLAPDFAGNKYRFLTWTQDELL